MGSLRIVAGQLGGRVLKAPPGDTTRPTSERVREALFSMLLARGAVPENVLDLYAGSGALGIEALSRGAKRAQFVEAQPRTAALIEDNLRALKLRAEVKVARVLDWLKRQEAGVWSAQFGWVFLDPPYAQAAAELPLALALLVDKGLLTAGAIIVAEHDAHTQLVAPPPLTLVAQRSYGQTAVTLFASP